LLTTTEEPVSLIVFDSLTYAADLQNLPNDSRIEVVVGDVRDFDLLSKEVSRVNEIFHLAAESHVDRSINDSRIFMETNTLGTLNVLEAVRLHGKRLVLVSTDEVYGSLEDGFAEETSVLQPSSPSLFS
jgi:dTDP-D-glucose 4,6-dehydratase